MVLCCWLAVEGRPEGGSRLGREDLAEPKAAADERRGREAPGVKPEEEARRADTEGSAEDTTVGTGADPGGDDEARAIIEDGGFSLNLLERSDESKEGWGGGRVNVRFSKLKVR